MTAHTHDDGFHEIQLNGKQLVFLFMAATVASVVIFLCGVLVGRGARVEGAAMAQAEAMNESPTADVPPASFAAAVPARTDVAPMEETPPPIVEDLSYGKRLEQANQSADELKPAAPRPALVARAPMAAPAVSPAAAVAPPVAKSSVAVEAPGTGSGYAVQVAALNVRDEADLIAKRLTSKGYTAYVQTPPGGTPGVFRVRVGTFKTRREAETVAAKLEKEERITPWITR